MTRYIDCEECHGSGIEECPKCGGTGEAENGEACSYCGGFGDIVCTHCGGSGQIEVEIDDEWAAMGW